MAAIYAVHHACCRYQQLVLSCPIDSRMLTGGCTVELDRRRGRHTKGPRRQAHTDSLARMLRRAVARQRQLCECHFAFGLGANVVQDEAPPILPVLAPCLRALHALALLLETACDPVCFQNSRDPVVLPFWCLCVCQERKDRREHLGDARRS